MVDPHPAIQHLPTLYSAPSSSSSDQELAEKGSCPRTFFHLFDWNCHSHGRRLFGHKSIFSGKANSDSTYKTCNDEAPVRPLDIAHDENRCGFSPAMETSQGSPLPKDQTPERKKKKSPSVVAKLMGLETMPSPEPCRRQRRPLDSQNPNLMRTPDKTLNFSNSRFLSIKQQRVEGDGNSRGCSSRSESSRKSLLPDLSHNQGQENGTRHKQHGHAQMQSMPSQAQERVHRNILPTSRPALAPFNSEDVRRNTGGDMVIEEKQEKPSEASTSKVQCLSLPVDAKADFKMVRGKESTSAQTSHPTVRTGADKSKVGAPSISTSNASAKEEEKGQASKHAKHVENDKSQADCRSSHHHRSCKTDVKVKQGFKKIEQTSKQLTQTAVDVKEQGTMLQKGKAKMGSSLLKESSRPKMDLCPLNNESLVRSENLNGQRDLSADSTPSCIEQAGPSSSTNNVARHKKLSRSTKDGSVKDGKLSKAGTRGPAQALSQSALYLKHAQKSHQHPLRGNNEMMFDALESADQNHSSHCDLEEMCRTENAPSISLHEQSETLGSSLTFESDIMRVKKDDGDVQGSPESSITCIFQDSISNESATRSTSNMFAKSTYRSICKSSLEEVGDTASSYEARSQKQTVSYSGKSTATILKELLLALNPSTKEFITEEECTTQAISSKEDLCHNRFQDPHCYTSEINHSLKECTHNCWHLNSNPTSALPSEIESAMTSESFSSIQESTCEEVSSKGLIKNKTCHAERGLACSRKHSGNFRSSWDEAMQNEESYVQHIVSSADLSLGRILSARLLCSGPLIEPLLFDKMEASSLHQWKWGIQHDEHEEEDDHSCASVDELINAAKINRKLVFDCIEEALRLDVGITEQGSMQSSLPIVDPPLYHVCSKRVQRLVDDWRDMACGINVDDIVEKEMNSGIGKWDEFSGENYCIAVEMELSILKDLINELVLSLSSDFQRVPMMISSRLHGPVKANKDRFFWVGL